MKVSTPTSLGSLLQAIKDQHRSTWFTCSLLIVILLGGLLSQAQTSVQNFGTGTFLQTASAGSTAIIPNPTSGTTWARGGAVVPAGPITGLNTSNPLGTTDSYLRGTASTSTSVAKMSPWVNYGGSTEFYTSFKILLGDVSAGSTAASGIWTFYQGAGAMYADASDFAGAQVFTGLRFVFAAAGVINLQYRGAGAWINTGLSPNTLAQATVYTIEIVGNNKASGTISYQYNGVPQTVAVQKFDLYVNGTKIGDDLAEALLPAGTSVASGTFIGISSTANVANAFVDDAVVYNAVPATIGNAAPAVTTDATPSVIGTITATLGGNITSDGGSPVTVRGVVYSQTSLNPTPAIGGGSVTNVVEGGTTTGIFSVAASSLPVNTQISYRAYGTNVIGTNYGGASGTTFYTLANTPNAPVVNGATSSSLNVAVGALDGNPAATTFAIQETGSSNYVQGDGTLAFSEVWQTATAWGTKTVTGLAASSPYTFQVKARNGALTETGFGATATDNTLSAASPVLGASSIADFGNVCIGTTTGFNTFTITGTNLTGANVTVAALTGFTYSTDDISYSASLSIAQGGGSFSQLIYVKFNPTLVQSYNGDVVVAGGGASGINAPATGSGVNTAPSVTTGSAGSITQFAATLNGTITADGCSGISAHGIEYSTSNGFANGTGTPVAGGTITLGAYSSNVSGLNPNVTYYYHAYATNIGGTSYGSEQSFVTSALDAPVANPGGTITGTSFEASWIFVPGATSYRLDVSTSPTFTTTNASDLFISEYVEGLSSNKYIEIYNGTGAAVNLSDYKLQLFTNGSPTVSTEVTLSGTLANGSTMVYKNSSAVVYLGAATNNSAVNYNGDDAVALFKISSNSFVDIFGSIGFDPGTAWTGAGGYSTFDKTLVRNANIAAGLAVNPGTSFPTLTTEWTLLPTNDVTNLGSHTFSAVSPSFVTGYNDLTVNGLSQTVTGLAPNTTYYYRVRAFSPTSTSANSNVETALTLCATVTATAGANGTVIPVGETSYNCGDNPVYTITANACYSIADVLVDGVSVGAVSTYTFTNISAGAHTISATFALTVYTVTASATGDGTISVDGVSNVNCGSDITYTITPGACSSIGDVLVDGVSVGAVSSYTFTNVTDNHTISVSFVLIPYTITVTQGSNGTIAPGSGTVDCGTDATYTITADPCYAIADVLVDGVSVGAVASYTFTNVQTIHTITASFAVITYTITASAGPNGTVTPAGASVVNCGSNNIYAISPAPCYSVVDVLVDGVSVGAVTTYTFTNTQANHTISATFVLNAALVAPVVTGTVNVCPNIGNGDLITYTANAVGAVSYSWLLPPNVVLQSSTLNTITVTFSNGFAAQANKQIRVTALSPCGNSPLTIYYLLAQAPGTPATITGNTNVCPIIGTANTYTYTIPAVPGASSYTWVAQAGTTSITHTNGLGINDTTVTVSFTNSFTTSAITVQAVNGCGTTAARSLTIVKANPSTPGLIAGPTNVCANIAPGGTPASYSVTNVAGNIYTWTVPGTAIGLTGQGTSSISFTYPIGYTGGTISVSASNGCGASGNRTLTVTKLNPGVPSAIDVIETQGCPNRIYSYTIATLPSNATSVQWTVPPAALSFTGQGTTSILVTYPTTTVTGTVTAQAINNCGTSTIRSVSVRLAVCDENPPPPPGPRTAKAGSAAVTTEATAEVMQVNVFPNPTVSDFKVQVVTAGKEKINVRIMDMQGRSLKQFVVMPYQATNIGADLNAGTYLLEVRQGISVKTTKLMKF